MTLLQPVAAMLLGLWAGVMARSGWAVYHDGVRPLLSEFADGNLTQSDLITLAGEANWPFVTGSLGLSWITGLPLAHWLWLPAEGLAFRGRRLWQSVLLGALWGAVSWLVVWGGRQLAGALPLPLLPAWDQAMPLVLAGYMFAPALAVWHRFGPVRGSVALTLSVIGAALAAWFAAPGQRLEWAAAGALLPGALLLGALALWELRGIPPEETGLPLRHRRAPLWATVVEGAVLALAVRASVFGWGMTDGLSAARHWWAVGAVTVLPLLLSFAPMWAAAQASTGVGQLAGSGLAILAGFLAPGVIWAPVLGGVAALVDLPLTRWLLRRTALSETSESMRWAMGKVAQPAVFAAALWAAAGLRPPGLGVGTVIAVTVVNDLLPKGIWKTAAPAWGLVVAGLLANLWHVLGGLQP